MSDTHNYGQTIEFGESDQGPDKIAVEMYKTAKITAFLGVLPKQLARRAFPEYDLGDDMPDSVGNQQSYAYAGSLADSDINGMPGGGMRFVNLSNGGEMKTDFAPEWARFVDSCYSMAGKFAGMPESTALPNFQGPVPTIQRSVQMLENDGVTKYGDREDRNIRVQVPDEYAQGFYLGMMALNSELLKQQQELGSQWLKSWNLVENHLTFEGANKMQSVPGAKAYIGLDGGLHDGEHLNVTLTIENCPANLAHLLAEISGQDFKDLPATRVASNNRSMTGKIQQFKNQHGRNITLDVSADYFDNAANAISGYGMQVAQRVVGGNQLEMLNVDQLVELINNPSGMSISENKQVKLERHQKIQEDAASAAEDNTNITMPAGEDEPPPKRGIMSWLRRGNNKPYQGNTP